jgi:CheY-like chemotaxis protein
MDHMMPEMDGIETTAKIREVGSEYAQKIPIIALTANAAVGNEKMFLESGFQAFLPKPVNIMNLDTVVRKFLVK